MIGAVTDEGVKHFTVLKVTLPVGEPEKHMESYAEIIMCSAVYDRWCVCLFVWVRDMHCECLVSCICHFVFFEDVLGA